MSCRSCRTRERRARSSHDSPDSSNGDYYSTATPHDSACDPVYLDTKPKPDDASQAAGKRRRGPRKGMSHAGPAKAAAAAAGDTGSAFAGAATST